MSCAEVRDAYLRGETPTGEAVERHVAACEACKALSASPTLGSWLAAPATFTPPVDPALEAKIAGVLAAERGLRAWLRSRSTRVRIALALGLCAAIALSQLLIAPSAGLGPTLWLCAVGLALSVAILLATSRPFRGWQRLLVFMLAAELPLFCTAYLKYGDDTNDFRSTTHCFVYGALFSLPLLALVLLADRRDRVPPLDSALIGAALGLLATVVLELACSSTNPGHLLFGHVSIGWVFIALLGAGAYARNARAR